MEENVDTAELSYSIRRLEKQEKVESFNCGDADLNDFIMNESMLYRNALLAVSYVAEGNTGRTIGYFSLANDRVSLTDFENNTAFNRFRRRRFVNDNKTGCRFVTVDAYAAAVPFYQRNGFEFLNDENAGDYTRLMFYDLGSI